MSDVKPIGYDPKIESCGNCWYAAPFMQDVVAERFVTCRRYPPFQNENLHLQPPFPRMRDHDWCGEWKNNPAEREYVDANM